MNWFFCLLGWHAWGKAYPRITSADSYRYEQRCECCDRIRIAPRRLWGPMPGGEAKSTGEMNS